MVKPTSFVGQRWLRNRREKRSEGNHRRLATVRVTSAMMVNHYGENGVHGDARRRGARIAGLDGAQWRGRAVDTMNLAEL